jgi:uncharacterized protein YggT (Ycf19 family)
VNTPNSWENATGQREAGASEPLSVIYEREAQAEERSAIPFVLKCTRVVTWIVYAVVLAKAALLAAAFLLRLAGANPDASFASWVYRSADRSMDPFRGIFPTRELTSASVLDLSLLFAAGVYLVVGMLIDAGLRWLGRQLSHRERRVAELRAAARDAASREYAAQHAAVAAGMAPGPRTAAGPYQAPTGPRPT